MGPPTEGDLPRPRRNISSRELRERKQHSLEMMWNAAVIVLTTLAFSFFVIADACQGGLGTSNGRMVSFLNSLNSVASYRRQRRVLIRSNGASSSPVSERRRSELLYVRSPRNCLAHRLKLFLLNFLAKFGSQSLGSLMIGATPVILKGPRHMASWLVAFACIQLCPRDSVFIKLQTHASLLLVVRVGCALYKLRKFNFVADFALARQQSFGWMVAAQIVVNDGNNLCSTLSTWTWLRGYSTTNLNDLKAGLASVLEKSAPMALASMLVRLVCVIHAPKISMKIFIFAMFLWRYDVPNLAIRACRQFARADFAADGHYPPPPCGPLTLTSAERAAAAFERKPSRTLTISSAEKAAALERRKSQTRRQEGEQEKEEEEEEFEHTILFKDVNRFRRRRTRSISSDGDDHHPRHDDEKVDDDGSNEAIFLPRERKKDR